MCNEFKTETQFVEKLYERIRAFNGDTTPKETTKMSASILQKEETFLKYGKLGTPHKRFVYFSENE